MVKKIEVASDINVRETKRLITPAELIGEIPMTPEASATVNGARKTIANILHGKDKRLLVIAGPCSIHDEKAAMEYAEKIQEYHRKMRDRVFIVMRVYFEKPRTTIGWKGLINDPHLDGSNDIATGLRKARKILNDINSMGLPTATELLDPIVPQYIANLVSWTAIGARTTESQTHREMASGLSMPVGFKNNTDGNLQAAVDAMKSCNHSHSFLGIDLEGRISVVKTKGNPNSHVILRGGRLGPNYYPESIAEAKERLENAGVDPLIMVDCSHANSNKKPENQAKVWESIIEQRRKGNGSLIGLMLESNLRHGNQPLEDISKLEYGVSITDACIGWEQSEELLNEAYDQMKDVSGV